MDRKSFADREPIVVLTPALTNFSSENYVKSLKGAADFTNSGIQPYFARFKEFSLYKYSLSFQEVRSSNLTPAPNRKNIVAWMHPSGLVIQWSETEDRNIYEYLMLHDPTGEWETIDYLEETKDLKQGSFTHFSTFFPSDVLEAVERLDWETTGDTLQMIHTFHALDWTTSTYRIHEGNRGGTYEFKGLISGPGENILKQTFIRFNADGSGSWKEFKPDGTIEGDGHWPK